MNTAARSKKRADPALTDRARAAGQEAGLGQWERSLRVNRQDEAVWLETGVVCVFVAPSPFIGAGIFISGPWWGKVLTIGVGLTVLAFGLLILTAVVIQKRTGIGLAHFFAAGLVVERTKGEILASPYDGLCAEFLTWMESTNDSSRARTRLWITMPQNKIVAIDVGNDAEGGEASWMAQRLGLPPTPRVTEEWLDETPMW